MRVSRGIGGSDESLPEVGVPLVGSASPRWTHRWCSFWQRDGRTGRVWQVDLAHRPGEDPESGLLVCQTMPDPPLVDITDADSPQMYAALCATALLLAATPSGRDPDDLIAAGEDLDGAAWTESRITLDGRSVVSRRSMLPGIEGHLVRLGRASGPGPGWLGVSARGVDPATVQLISGVDQGDYPFRRTPEPL